MRDGGYGERHMSPRIPTPGRAMSPRIPTPGRPKSVREVYHPAVQDLSEQAARNGAHSQEESILNIISPYMCTSTPRQSTAAVYNNGFYSPMLNPYSPGDEQRIPTTPTQLSYSHATTGTDRFNTSDNEDIHRQRVLISAHQRRKLNPRTVRRSQSTPACTNRASSSCGGTCSSIQDRHRTTLSCTGTSQAVSSCSGTIVRPTTAHDRHRYTPCPTSDEDTDIVDLVVTNGLRHDDTDFKERINYKLTNRTKPKSAHTPIMSNGAPLPVVNGYSQTLLQTYPQYTQNYCKWLTNGFKVQSVRSGNRSREFSHARPPPPLVQYINRPKTVNGRLTSRHIVTDADINIVGTQKEVTQQKPEVTDVHAHQGVVYR